MIKILLNDDPIELVKDCFISEVLQQYGHVEGCFAVALNRKVIRREELNSTIVKDGDVLELIFPMQGG